MSDQIHADADKLEEIARKIAKLAEMTTENGATASEAEAAAGKIAALFAKYAIDAADVDAARQKIDQKANQPSADAEIKIASCRQYGVRRFVWEERLAGAVARGFFCKSLLYDGGFYFVGTARDTAIAISVFERLRPVALALASKATKDYSENMSANGYSPRELRGELSLKTYKLAYLEGFASGIDAKLETEKRRIDTENGGKVTALVVVRDAAIDTRISQQWPTLRRGRKKGNGDNEAARYAGFTAGRNQTIARADLEG